MVVVMQKGVSQEQIAKVQKHLEAEGYSVHLSQGAKRTIMGVIGEPARSIPRPWHPCPGGIKSCPSCSRLNWRPVISNIKILSSRWGRNSSATVM